VDWNWFEQSKGKKSQSKIADGLNSQVKSCGHAQKRLKIINSKLQCLSSFLQPRKKKKRTLQASQIIFFDKLSYNDSTSLSTLQGFARGSGSAVARESLHQWIPKH
jgi:hypothetical protein